MENISFVQDLAFILLTAGVAAWLFRALGFSSLVGCILAGVIIGPFTPLFPTVSDVGRVESLAQIGLIFIMFWVGLGFSLQRLRRLGLHTLLANVIGAIILFQVFRLVGDVMGWSSVASLFLAAMTMVSSSAIIMKTLGEAGINHEKNAQRALTISIGEDAVVIGLLTLLASYIHVAGEKTVSVPVTLGLLTLFVTLFLIVGLISVPKALDWLRKNADSETTTVVLTGFIFLLALISLKAGYSMALGAFLLGAIIADTGSRLKIERLLNGVYFLLSAVFFTAIGMLIDPFALKTVWPSILTLSALIIVFRVFAYSFGLLLIGTRLRDAVTTSLYLTPIGEFSFIIATLGVTGGVLSKDTYALAVGICFATSLTSPLLVRQAEIISQKIESITPVFLINWLDFYQKFLFWLSAHQKDNLLWQLGKPRLWQLFRELILISSLLIFAPPLYRFLTQGNHITFLDPRLIFWFFSLLVAVAVSLPLLALWRNLSACSLLFSEGLTRGLPNRHKLAPSLNLVFQITGFIVFSVWLLFLLPWGQATSYSLFIWIGLLFIFILVFQRRLILWHSRFELLLDESNSPLSKGQASWSLLRDPVEELNLDLVEVEIPDETPHAGKTISQLNLRKTLGSTIAGIERQGFLISAPSPDEHLYPNDRVLILGKASSIKASRDFLQQTSKDTIAVSDFAEICLNQLTLSPEAKIIGKSLGALNLARDFGLTIVGIKREGILRLNLESTDTLKENDEIVILASPAEFTKFCEHLL
ncbi:MAG: cation:proton antiporter [Blastochloris sp.]|jgi:CPA2 family monovalent cation:H+ antiporter-2|nr:cation:proton antiporter [Blastochloris sp.]